MIGTVLLVLSGVAPAPKPRLVVVITVDQLRPDYLDRYRSQLTGGLGRLLRQGAYFADAYQDHAVTETAPGHSTILSGRWPAHTGIISNVIGVSDSSAPLLDVPGPGASGLRLRPGASFADASQDPAVTEPAPGHSTILSGRWPAHTGIISNVIGVSDSSAPLLDAPGPGTSPARRPRASVGPRSSTG